MKHFLSVIFLAGFLFLARGATDSEAEPLIRRLEQKSPPLGTGDWQPFADACATADEAQCDRLATILSKEPTEAYNFSVLSSPLFAARFRLILGQLKKQAPALELPTPALKGSPPKISTDLAAARDLYLAASKPYQKLVEVVAGKERIEYQPNRGAYEKLAANLLRHQTKVQTEDFLAYEWGGWCGTGMENFTAPNSRAVFLSLVAEKRYPEALGAALQIQEGHFTMGEGMDAFGFLSLFGPAWEDLVAGALAETLLSPEQNPANTGFVLMGMLGSHGTEKSAARLIELGSLANPDVQPEYIAALGAFLNTSPPGKNSLGEFNRGRYLSDLIRTGPPVSPAIQAQILDFFDRISGGEAPFDTCRSVADALNGKDFPAARNILNRLLQHPSEDVSGAAANSLTGLGETFTPPAKPLPVSFLVQLNGQPLRTSKLSWAVGNKERSVSSEATTTDAGALGIPNKYLTDPALKVENVRIASLEGSSPGDALFYTALPKPKDLQEEQVVNIAVQPLELHILPPKAGPFFEKKAVTISLQKASDGELMAGTPLRSSFVLPAADKIQFTRLQQGAYSLKVDIPGAASFRLNLARLDSPSLEVKLEPGADVKIKLLTPEGWRSENLKRVLIRNGKELDIYDYFNYQSGELSGLSFGDYVLRIPASTEQQDGLGLKNENAKTFRALEVPFRIDAESPPVIDLGEFKLL